MLRSFAKSYKGYWNNETTQRIALETFGRKKLGVKELDDWYCVAAVNVHRELGFLQKYGSLFDALKSLYPEKSWDPLRFAKVPSGYWTDENAQRHALEKLGREKFGVKELDDWYSIPAASVRNELSFIGSYYNNSLLNALKCLYPQHDWDPLRFSRVPSGYWSDRTAQKKALEALGRKLGVKDLDDWYSVSIKTVRSELSFLQKYRTLFDALKEFYPEHQWDPLRFSRVPNGSWNDENVQRIALEKFGEKLGVKELDDWYAVSAKDVHKELHFISKYGSLFDALKALYPQHDWDPIRVSRVPSGYWTDVNAQRDALERLGKRLGVKELDDWYSVSVANVRRELSFFKEYKSLYEALKKLYPQHKWDPLRFSKGSRTDAVHREALDRLGKKLGVKELDDWYSVSAADVHRKVAFLQKYGTLFDALKRLYPQHDWDPLRFSRAPHGYWTDENTVKHYYNMFMNWKKVHNIQTVSDWYTLSPQQVQHFERAARGIFGSKMKMLQEWFPEILWQWQFTAQLELKNLINHVIVDATLKHHRASGHSSTHLHEVDTHYSNKPW